jgi:hypothetical protein
MLRAAMAPPTASVPVMLEVGARRVFASALDWPGWCRWGKDEQGALAALAAAAPRYALVTAEAGAVLPTNVAGAMEVVERLPGSMATDFGVPGAIGGADARPLTREGATRLAALISASWTVFDRIVAAAPAELRKGPRGGGRDRDKIVEHVLGGEVGYARKIGLRLSQPARDDSAAVSALRAAITEVLRQPSDGSPMVPRGWPARYAARRIAWHVLDHGWEIEDRSVPL